MKKISARAAAEAQAVARAKEDAARRAAFNVPGGPKIEVVGYKECRGMEGPAFSYTLVVDGVKAADVQNSGTGGGTYGRFFSKALEALVGAHVAKIPAIPSHGTMLDVDMELFLGELAEDYAEAQRLKRMCKTRVVFRETPESPWIEMSALFTASLRAKLVVQHGERIEFANETYAGQKAVEETPEQYDARMLQPYLKKGLGCFRSAKTENKWKVTQAVFSPAVRAAMEAKFGPGVEFFNDRAGVKAA
jgi:hypothetical protein